MSEDAVQTESRILCASCGSLMAPNSANMCVGCIRGTVDITEGIPKQATVYYCRDCERYLQPPAQWQVCTLESRELLALLLKKLKGLTKVRLVDASFIWTEPHSRRIKVKLTIQKEVFSDTILQQTFIVEYVVSTQQCPDCTRIAASQTWKAVVQLRQKVTHKRTFLWLEQLILKHGAHRDTVNIKEARDGIDFYYVQRGHAIRMMDFLATMVPVRVKKSEEIISSDIRNNTANFRFSYSAEIVPLCRDDLVCLPIAIARQLSCISPLVLVSRVSSTIQFLDFATLQTVEMRNNTYWDNPFFSLTDIRQLTEFYVIDVEIEHDKKRGKLAVANVEVALATNLSVTFTTRTHLGHILNPGDHVLGYDLTNVNFNNDQWDALLQRTTRSSLPDVVLVKKSYRNARRKIRQRHWKLKKLAIEAEAGLINRGKAEQAREDMDYELFLRDLEEDKDMRAMVNLYRNPDAENADGLAEDAAAAAVADGDDDSEIEEDFPEIELDELIDEMADMTIVEHPAGIKPDENAFASIEESESH
ncbi:hypothetical protein CXG81DRAFT_8554 [Caulochytrium protostelioides]|uniref:60S ribosomal export protein NMD3 n=1 Tax=Caulochytrium protostelioides TaxID=1555241 RepID=A0A4V1IVI7_9FUNG|nr:hypothetical protein CXG81DRAFT_8554 [Caulochytrium protostelioides]|eukprot:RKP04199.1 hypothetical protein CXG81DRAFT_8554 [Caulochytrium protostelioides]